MLLPLLLGLPQDPKKLFEIRFPNPIVMHPQVPSHLPLVAFITLENLHLIPILSLMLGPQPTTVNSMRAGTVYYST